MKFCFFGEISGALKGRTTGGAELQIVLLARALAIKGHEIVIIDPASAESFMTSEGIKIINLPKWNKGIRGIRMIVYRIPYLWKIFLSQNADFYYVRMKSYFHLIPFLAARKLKRKFIQGIASDIDLLSLREKIKYQIKGSISLFQILTAYIPSVFAFNFLLKHADYVIAQHSGQLSHARLVKGRFVMFPNIVERTNLPIAQSSSGNYFIYVGSLSILKGADKLYQLVRMIDTRISIVIVGQPNDQKSKSIFEKLSKIENVIVKGRLPQQETLKLMSNAKALINTSNYEGFPNVFLEAWSIGLPVISLNVNPGEVFDKYNLGVCCDGDMQKMKLCIEENVTSNINKEDLRDYVSTLHDFDTAANRFLKILQ